MCIAAPGRVISINGGIAEVDYAGNVVRADIRLVDAEVGDYVLVHAGCAIEVMKREAAEDLAALFAEVEEAGHERP